MNKEEQTLKIIDCDRKGNVVRFYLGADDCEDYWGDDWDDRPYDCNAGAVYDRYVTGIKDIAFPFDDYVLEPESAGGYTSPWYSKDDMKKRKVPCIIAVPKGIHGDEWHDGFHRWVCADGVQKFYFGDQMEP